MSEQDAIDTAYQLGWDSEHDEGCLSDMDEPERVAFYRGKEDRAAHDIDRAVDRYADDLLDR